MRTFSDRRAILIGSKSKYLLDYPHVQANLTNQRVFFSAVENRISNTNTNNKT